jgi:hypothetical protein
MHTASVNGDKPGSTQSQANMERHMSIWKQRVDSNNGGYISHPGDVIEIINDSSKHCATLHGHILIRLRNELTGELLPETSLPNKLAAWQFLKGVSEIGGREVEYVTVLDGEEVERIPYADSIPYKYRFG